MDFSTLFIIIFSITILVGAIACYILGRKLDDISHKIERRNSREINNRQLYRYTD